MQLLYIHQNSFVKCNKQNNLNSADTHPPKTCWHLVNEAQAVFLPFYNLTGDKLGINGLKLEIKKMKFSAGIVDYLVKHAFTAT